MAFEFPMQSNTMKTKIIAVLVMVAASFGCGVVWGQHFTNNGDLGAGPWQRPQGNQDGASYFDQLTNLAQVELEELNYCRGSQRQGALPRTPPAEQPANYSSMTEEQKDIFDVLYRAAQRVQEFTDSDIKRLNWNKAALLREKHIPLESRHLNFRPSFRRSAETPLRLP